MGRTIFRTWLLWCFTCFAGIQQAAAIDVVQLRFNILDIKSGLSQNNVSHIYQDSKGYMWFCTDEGLNRYDGYRFAKFQKDIQQTNSLVSNFTSCIVESAPGIFWIGTEKGLSVYFYDTKEYLNLANPAQVKKLTVEDSVTVWMQTQYSLYKIRLIENEGKATSYSLSVEPMNAYREIIYKNGNTQFLLAGRDNYLYTYSFSTKLIQKKNIHTSWSKVLTHKINQVITDKDGQYWVGTNNGLYTISKNHLLIDSFPDSRKIYQGLQDKITDIGIGKFNNIYIGTLQHGLLVYDVSRKKFIEYQSDPYSPNALPDNKTTCLYFDKSGTLWVGTKSSGVAYSSPFEFKFKHFTQEPFKTTWLTNKYVLCFETDAQENIWIGTDGGGLYRFNTKENIFSNWRNNNTPASLSNDIIQDILLDKNGNIWAGTLNGICLFNPANNSFRRFFLTESKDKRNLKIPAYNNIRLIQSLQGAIYAIVENNVYRFDPAKFAFIPYSTIAGNGNIITRSIIETADSTWWMATNAGLFHYTPQKKMLDEAMLQKINQQYFKTEQLYSLLADGDLLWIGSGNSGLYLFDPVKMDIREHYTEEDGLCNNFVYGILKDDQGKLWLSTNRGISVFDPLQKRFRNYDINDGLQSNEFNVGAYHKTQSNELLFGGINGFNIIEPDKIPFNAYKPAAIITSVKVNEQYFDFMEYQPLSERIRLQNKQNNIAFEFASSDYANTPKNRFEYKLDGYDKDWTNTERNYASYAQLPPGNYTFYVRASNNDGVWSSAPAAFTFRIRPMFWQTWWFRIFAGISIVLAGYRMISNRIQTVRNKEKERMQIKSQRTEFEKQLAEIKLKALVAQMNPHFIFNCMNSIQAMILSDQSIQASTYLTKLSRLVRSVLENSVKTFIPLQDTIENLKLYLELESLRFNQHFNYHITTDGLDVYSVELPSMLIQPYVENSIWHGLLKKEGEKNIDIRFYRQGKFCICEVTDNGIGREAATQMNLGKKHKSLGTFITQEMFDTLQKIKETDYTVETVDLYDENGKATGTRVIIRMELD